MEIAASTARIARRCIALLISASAFLPRASAVEIIHDYPGEGIARNRVRWLAPYVQEVRTRASLLLDGIDQSEVRECL
jgi:hypothetical protein